MKNHYQPHFLLNKNVHHVHPYKIIEHDLGTLDNQHTHRRSRPKSALPLSLNDNSAFHIVHNPALNHQQQYIALLKILKSQEIQVEQQQQELNDKQKGFFLKKQIFLFKKYLLEIDYREKTIHHSEIENEFHLLTEHDRRLTSDCQLYSEDYSTNELNKELDYGKNLHSNFNHIQQQLARSSTTLDQKRQIQDQLQLNIEQIHREIEHIKTNINNDKKVCL